MTSTVLCQELLSESEKGFILEGIRKHSLRLDGRKNEQRRQLQVYENPVSQAMGSCRVVLPGGTDVLVAIKGEIRPEPQMQVTVQNSNFTKNSQEERNALLSQFIAPLCSTVVMKKGRLVILEGRFYWGLTAEVLVISDGGGGLFDAVTFAVGKALAGCRLFHVQVEMGGEAEALTISDDPAQSQPLLDAAAAAEFPRCLEIGVVNSQINNNNNQDESGPFFLLDLSLAEAECCDGIFWVALDPPSGRIFSYAQVGRSESTPLLPPQIIPQVLAQAS